MNTMFHTHRYARNVMCAIMIISIMLPLFGCTSSDSVIVDTSAVRYCCTGSGRFGFNINLLSTDKDTAVEFIRFDGENTDKINVSFSDDTWDIIKNKKISGYYVKILGFVCDTSSDYTSISSMTLSIDGCENTYIFDEPLIHYYTENNDNQCVNIVNVPSLVSIASLNPKSANATTYQFIYNVQSDIVVYGFSFDSYLTFYNTAVYVNDAFVGYASDCFPLSVNENSVIKINTGITGNSLNYIESVYCNYKLEYCDNRNNLHKLRNSLVCQCAINEKEMNDVVNYIIDKQKYRSAE